MLCSTRNCSNETLSDESHLCCRCFEQKWGPSPIQYIPLPICLTNIVLHFLDFDNEDYVRNLDLLYLKLDSFSICTLARFATWDIQWPSRRTDTRVISYMLYPHWPSKQNDTKILPFLADRYCRSTYFWRGLYGGPVPYEKILPYDLNAGKVFTKYHQMQLTPELLNYAVDMQNDYLDYELLEKRDPVSGRLFENMTYSKRYEKYIFKTIVSSQSYHVIKSIIEIGYFAHRDNIIFVLKHIATVSRKHWLFYRHLWKACFRDTFLAEHIPMLLKALKRLNFPMLDFLVSLRNAVIPLGRIRCFLNRCNENNKMIAWLIRNKHIVTLEWATHIDKLKWPCLLKLVEFGVFPNLPDAMFTDVMVNQNVVKILLYQSHNDKNLKHELLLVLSKLVHLGPHAQTQNIVKTICTLCSIQDLQRLLEYPVIQRALTFTTLREARYDFLSRLFANKPSIVDLEWFAAWRDEQRQTLTRGDVDAKNKSLLRLAKHTNNTQLQTWILQFEDAVDRRMALHRWSDKPLPKKQIFDESARHNSYFHTIHGVIRLKKRQHPRRTTNTFSRFF